MIKKIHTQRASIQLDHDEVSLDSFLHFDILQVGMKEYLYRYTTFNLLTSLYLSECLQPAIDNDPQTIEAINREISTPTRQTANSKK